MKASNFSDAQKAFILKQTDVYLRVAGAINEIQNNPEFAEKLLRRALVGLTRTAGIDPEKSRLEYYALVDVGPLPATN